MLNTAGKQIYIVAAKRTPFGAFGGALKDRSATELCLEATNAALAAGKIDPSIIDTVFVGNVSQTSADGAYIARHVQLKAGVPMEVPALTVNRLCGSGFQSVVNGAQEIQLGEASVALCGGAENMSMAPLAVYGNKARFGVNLGAGLDLQDTLWAALTDSHAKTPMGVTAENLAEKYGITREECDEYAVRSQNLCAQANSSGYFDAEMAPLEVRKGKKTETMSADEGPRQVTLDKLSTMKPVFKKDGVVTAANASGISDGAGAILLASEEAVKKHNLTPLARLAGYHMAGVDPTIMGIGPVPAIQGALKKAGLSKDDIDIFDINEAFAPQFLSCVKELGLDMDKTNLAGGAISLGHPLGASGSRITAHLTHALQRNQKRYAVGSACIGGGQGIALVLENMV